MQVVVVHVVHVHILAREAVVNEKKDHHLPKEKKRRSLVHVHTLVHEMLKMKGDEDQDLREVEVAMVSGPARV